MVLDLSEYFDIINHDMLLKILIRNIKDERVVQIIKRYLKSGVMENGVVKPTEEGSPQGENLSPLLANIYLNEFDKEFEERILESSTRYLGKNLKLKALSSNRRVQSVLPALKRIQIYMRGWLNSYAVASKKENIETLNKWLYHRIRMCIWKMWKRPRSKMK